MKLGVVTNSLLCLTAHCSVAATAATASESAAANIGYSPEQAARQAERLSSHSWEFGTASEALLELYNASLSVFSPSAFPHGRIPTIAVSSTRSLAYAAPKIRLHNTTLIDGDGASGDPCSLGVSALLIGQTNASYRAAADRQAAHLLYAVPKWPNGAISQRENIAELWADFVYMAPPFLAYYAVATGNSSLLRYTAQQCNLYRQVLQPAGGRAWRHIIGPQNQDLGLWSTGNGWAAMGMARVLATAMHWRPSACDAPLHTQLMREIGQIVAGAMVAGRDPTNGLLRNYLNDSTWFGETSGTSAITAAVYRLAVLQREPVVESCGRGCAEERAATRPVTPAMLAWADTNRRAVAKHVNGSGIAAPAVNPLGWGDRTPYTAGSPEGESFLVLMFTAWRDCIAAGVCPSK